MNGRLVALRASEVGLVAAGWIFVSGLLFAFGPLPWSPGPGGLGVYYPAWPVILINTMGGMVALLFAAARAWNHQPSNLSWISAVIGALIVAAPFIVAPQTAMAPQMVVIHNVIMGLILGGASVLCALEAHEAITDTPWLDWGGHAIFASAMPTEEERAAHEDEGGPGDPPHQQ